MNSEILPAEHRDLAYLAYRMAVDGDDTYDELMTIMERLGYLNIHGEWDYNNEED